MTISGAGYPMCRHSRKASCTWWCTYHRMVWLLLGIAGFMAVIIGVIALVDPAEAVRKLGQIAIAIPVFAGIVWLSSIIFPTHDRAVREWRPDEEGSSRRARHR